VAKSARKKLPTGSARKKRSAKTSVRVKSGTVRSSSVPSNKKRKSAPPTTAKRKSRFRPDELEKFKATLLTKRQQLLGDVSDMREQALHQSRKDAAGDLSSVPIHMADIGTDNYEQEFTLGLIENREAVLREIDEALQRIEDGTYGTCLATGKPISKARLKLNPWAKYCVEYARKAQTGNNRGPGAD